ncbi:hypothetical protein F2Q69_00038516 [Brassica cretica]|uniref:Uncharacterized protein n=1 Tax=Brassica cretica TaxID=69181 RepID=A0A8S9SI28_BRACR|nr:hypothetical protein F2Q69_00038516 [Brassica cretica]
MSRSGSGGSDGRRDSDEAAADDYIVGEEGKLRDVDENEIEEDFGGDGAGEVFVEDEEYNYDDEWIF